jgi:hypothetical protein
MLSPWPAKNRFRNKILAGGVKIKVRASASRIATQFFLSEVGKG